MDTEEIIKRLRQPASRRRNPSAQMPESAAQSPSVTKNKRTLQDILLFATLAAVVIFGALALFITLGAKTRAENVSEELDPSQIDGLVVQADFNPNLGVTYVAISEGQDRNVAVSNLGTTLPIISLYNYQSFTSDNFQLLGTAPWAITTNIAANLEDIDMIKYLLSNDNMTKAFIIRSDVSPLLYDHNNLAALVKDARAMKEFFTDDTTQKVLASEPLLNAFFSSRFMSFLLVSDSGKYFRTHPQEAADLISQSPYLRELQTNENVAKAVRSNRYLANIARILLTPQPDAQAQAPQPQQAPAANSKNKKARKKNG